MDVTFLSNEPDRSSRPAILDARADHQNQSGEKKTSPDALLGRTIAEVERHLILMTLDHCLGNRTHAARLLGISVRTLRNKLNEYADEGFSIPQPGQTR